tara:strand:- start:897 stop:1724 length:828 start_codon:yes stop_codon:yes gene_type:complete
MTKTLFLGDSHSHGYYEMGGQINAWHSNNYAEIYARENNKQTIIYSAPGACNRKYPIWLKAMLERYDDIDEVFIQSTYWNRFLMACSRNQDVGDGIKADHFIDDQQEKDELIHRYCDHRITDDYVELTEKPRSTVYEEFKGFQFYDGKDDYNFAPLNEKYAYSKLWHELVTHLQYKDYCIDLFAIDTMLRKRNIKWYLWSINNRVFVPKHIDFFEKLSCIKADKSAEAFLKEKFEMDIETDKYRLDSEHYIKEVHLKIAKDYFGYIKSSNNESNA